MDNYTNIIIIASIACALFMLSVLMLSVFRVHRKLRKIIFIIGEIDDRVDTDVEGIVGRVRFNSLCLQYALLSTRYDIMAIKKGEISRENFEGAKECEELIRQISNIINTSID